MKRVVVGTLGLFVAVALHAQLTIGFSAPSRVKLGSSFTDDVVVTYTGTQAGSDYLEVDFSTTTSEYLLHLNGPVTGETPNPANCKNYSPDSVTCYAIQPFHPGSIFKFHVPLRVDSVSEGHNGGTLYVAACSFRMTGGPFVRAQEDFTYTAPQPDLIIGKYQRTSKIDFETWRIEYVLDALNAGPDPTIGRIVVRDHMPFGIVLTEGGDFTKTASGQLVSRRCTLEDGIIECTTDASVGTGMGETFIIDTLTRLPEGSTISNTATVSGGGDVDPTNNTSREVTFVVGDVVLDVVANHVNGKNGASIVITVKNTGTKASLPPIIGDVQIQGKLTLGSLEGTGCNRNSDEDLTCKILDSLPPGGSKVITIPITSIPDGLIVNTIHVTGGGAANTAQTQDIFIARSGSVLDAPDLKVLGGR